MSRLLLPFALLPLLSTALLFPPSPSSVPPTPPRAPSPRVAARQASLDDVPFRDQDLHAWAELSVPSGNGTVRVDFRGFWDGKGTEVGVQVRGLEDGKEYAYHIHASPVPSSGDCKDTGLHLDPYFVSNWTTCHPDHPQYCQVGDLSGKHGKISRASFTANYTDNYLRFLPARHSLLGRSVVLHSPSGPPLACANILSLLDSTSSSSSSTYVTPAVLVSPLPGMPAYPHVPFASNGTLKNSTALPAHAAIPLSSSLLISPTPTPSPLPTPAEPPKTLIIALTSVLTSLAALGVIFLTCFLIRRDAPPIPPTLPDPAFSSQIDEDFAYFPQHGRASVFSAAGGEEAYELRPRSFARRDRDALRASWISICNPPLPPLPPSAPAGLPISPRPPGRRRHHGAEEDEDIAREVLAAAEARRSRFGTHLTPSPSPLGSKDTFVSPAHSTTSLLPHHHHDFAQPRPSFATSRGSVYSTDTSTDAGPSRDGERPPSFALADDGAELDVAARYSTYAGPDGYPDIVYGGVGR